MTKGFGETSVSLKKNSKSSSLMPAPDCEQVEKQLFEHFEDLRDPRGSQGVLHPFISIVMIALLAKLYLTTLLLAVENISFRLVGISISKQKRLNKI